MPHWESTLHPGTARYADIGYRTRYLIPTRKRVPTATRSCQHGGQPDPVFPPRNTGGRTRALAREFRVVAADSLGHGSTENPHWRRLCPLLRADVEHLGALIGHLGLQRVHWSGTARAAGRCAPALNRPDVAKCLVSTDTVMAPFTPDISAVRYCLRRDPPSGRGTQRYTLLRGDAFIAALNNIVGGRRTAARTLPAAEFAEARDAMGRIMMSRKSVLRKLREQLAEVSRASDRTHLIYWGRTTSSPSGARAVSLPP